MKWVTNLQVCNMSSSGQTVMVPLTILSPLSTIVPETQTVSSKYSLNEWISEEWMSEAMNQWMKRTDWFWWQLCQKPWELSIITCLLICWKLYKHCYWSSEPPWEGEIYCSILEKRKLKLIKARGLPRCCTIYETYTLWHKPSKFTWGTWTCCPKHFIKGKRRRFSDNP